MYTLLTRRRIDGRDMYGYPDGRWSWSEWEPLTIVKPGDVADSLAYWVDLNAFAVRERGPANTAREFRVVEGIADFHK